MRNLKFSSIILVLSVITLLLNACAPQVSQLEQVKQDGVLKVITRNSPTTYFIGPHGHAGLEYDLVTAFADHLGVKAEFKTQDNLNTLLQQIETNKAHIAAAGLTVTEVRKARVRFTTPYQEITQQVIYRTGNRRPRSIDDILLGHLEVIANSSHAERLKELQQEWHGLSWEENTQAKSTELLNLVAEQLIDYTIADSNEAALQRRYHPELRVAFDISEAQGLAWAMSRGEDNSLYNEALAFFARIKENGKLEQILAQHYGHVRNYNYAGTRTYLRHMKQRMSRYQDMFEQAAYENDLDWRLLAAVSYQESNWNPRAVSPTGVRGMMMLTQTTAKQLGINKRTDPQQSIEGGARYISSLYERFDELAEPDRTWFTLASYNVGFGHVKDARKITTQLGGNPDKWTDVKESLPLLRQRKWYKKTQYGYARGHEPVRYVENIRSYYDILRWEFNSEPTPYTVKAK
ncbi:MAG: membrane-bound lytic murein transglycosylase MltF, partial [Gammaproteobacteria bacterium]|nr:membrane-bound lytic murein transglycosylase MltF [Gammaproteobacteria bacterium]